MANLLLLCKFSCISLGIIYCRLIAENVACCRKEFGDLESVADTSLFGALGSFLDAELPVHSLSSDEQAGAQSRVQRAAVLLWIWLEIRYCPLLAAEVCGILKQAAA